MVTTRSQVRHHNVDDPDQPTPTRRSVQMLLDDTAKEIGDVNVEKLGRGCRVHRPTVTLDEQYLQSLSNGNRGAGGGTGFSRNARNEPEELVINERYPPRAAAQRALSSLQMTLNEDTDDDAPQQQEFNFRHHPEVGAKLSRKKGRSWKHTNSASSSTSDDSAGSTTESSSAHSTSDDDDEEEDDDSQSETKQSEARTLRGTQSTVSTEGNTGRRRVNLNYSSKNNTSSNNNTGSHHTIADRKRGRDSSVDSSISIQSLREESIDDLARRDARDNESLSSEDASGDVATEEEMRRAMRHAKESTEKNININYYIADAVGEEDPTRTAKKKLDRRYRHLFMEDEESKANGGAGATTGGAPNSASGALGDISPLRVDQHITFDSVGGLPGHIVTLREMVLLPLLYPQLLKQMGLSPPRGVLFVGPPGTGKTLLARALASEGSRYGGKPITFFIRKGADILSKWVGESERQLSLLFEEAKRQQPSIIFFDEIDGLAPTRHTKTEQTQAALVATFLALLDGLDDRGQVVVIGATNRPDTIDPALRRPGRFDRELMFPLPDAAARLHILQILTAKQSLPSRADVLEALVSFTEGYSGADLKALCTEAGLNRLRTALPQLYTTNARLQVPPEASLALRKEDFLAAARRIQPSLQRGGAELRWTHMEEHLECLFRGVRDRMLQVLSETHTAVERALQKEKRDCADLMTAVRNLSSFPVPYAHHATLLFMHTTPSVEGGRGAKSSAAVDQMVLLNASKSVMRALPTFQTFMVHLPHVLVSFTDMAVVSGSSGGGGGAGAISGSAGAGSPYADTFKAGHMYDLVQSIQRSSPCVVVLRGVDEWLAEHGYVPSMSDSYGNEEAVDRRRKMDALRYYLNLLADTEVVLLLPSTSGGAFVQESILGSAVTASGSTKKKLHNGSPLLEADSIGNGLLHPHYSVLSFGISSFPTAAEVSSFVDHVHRLIALAFSVQDAMRGAMCGAAGSLPNDPSPPPESLSAQHAKAQQRVSRKEEIALWRKVEYRRLQLRHVLIKWMTQFINSGKFKILLSCDLDMGEDHPLYSQWRRHTKGCRIGLQDILEKLEAEEYICLSQYHEDVDQLVRNVRSFFRSRSPNDQKYRLKALELKETTVLNMYKINRSVVRFCEANRDVVEPDFSSDDDDDGAASVATDLMSESGDPAMASQKSRAKHFSKRWASPASQKPRRKVRIFGQRRRRRRPPHAAAAKNDDEDPVAEVAEVLAPHGDLRSDDAVANNEEGSGVEEEKKGDDDVVALSQPPAPHSPTQPPEAEVQRWAITLLSGQSYHALHRIFQLVMHELELEVRRRDTDDNEDGGGGSGGVTPFFRRALQYAVGGVAQ